MSQDTSKKAPSEAKTFREIVGEAIGEASMCWSETPTGVFESTRASAIVDRIFDAFHLEAGMNVTRWVKLNVQLKETQTKYDQLIQQSLLMREALKIIAHGELPDGDGVNMSTVMFAEKALEQFDEFMKEKV